MKLKSSMVMIALAAAIPLTSYPIYAQEASYESDIDYIVTKYVIGDYEEAIRLLHKHYAGYQNELAYLYGLCYLKLHINRMALDYLNTALAEHENNYEVLNNIGVAYYQDGDYINAMKYFHLSFVSNPDYPVARENYNAAYASWTSQSESIQPVIPFTEKTTLYSSLGWFYYYCGDLHNAVYYFKKAIDEDEKYQFAYISLAYIYDEGNNFEAALRYLKDAEAIDGNNPDLYNNLGIVYYHKADYEGAEYAFRRALA